jgi:hypothetical protein
VTLPTPSAHFVTAEDVYHAHPQHPEHTPAEAAVFRHWRHHAGVPGPQRLQMRGPWPNELAASPVAKTYVNHGRWCVDCPFEGCSSAQYASKTDHRFFCIECSNAGTGKWVPVAWPEDLELAAIEAALALRPVLSVRNWHPGEAVADLEAQNKIHGVN